MKTIKINVDSDNRPIVESGAQCRDSLFKAQYKQGFEAIESILLAQRVNAKALDSIQAEIKPDVDASNNIIVFDGDRGTGKTSCMLSVVNMLLESEDNELLKGQKLLRTTTFAKLPMLDPAFFDGERNVLSLVISRLYHLYSCKSHNDISPDVQQLILEQFVEVQKNLKSMFKHDKSQDELEYLVGLSATVALRENIQKLVSLYLEHVEKKEKLLILVDDIDLNQERACSMVEELRKYLVLDNCILLVSVKIKQLEGILYQCYLKEYRDKEVDEGVRNEVRLRVDRYLSKLFPQRHRIHMPLPEDYLHYGIEIEGSEEFDYMLLPNIAIEQSVPELIFAKTRYLFYNTRKSTSLIVPRNLRSIRQLLKLLMEMPNYQDGDVDNPTAINKEIFKHYFFNDWIEQNIPVEHKDFVSTIIQKKNYADFNYVVSAYLSSMVEGLDTRSGFKSYLRVLDKKNSPGNISLGDVFGVMRMVESLNHELYTPELLFFIRSLYSIRLYESYDGITKDIIADIDKQNQKYLICRNESDVITDDYQALVAGAVYNTEIETFLLKSEYASLKLNASMLKVLVAKACANDDKNLYKLIELIMLFVSYEESDDTDGNYRHSIQTYYKDLTLEMGQPLVASIGAFIYNLARYEESINRFKNIDGFQPFFDVYSLGGDWTLHHQLIENAKECRSGRQNKSDESKLKSICCFRNMEVLEDFYESVKGKAGYGNDTAAEALACFFDEASKYSINTYDRYEKDGDKVPYNINFSYLRNFATLLRTPAVVEEFNKLITLDNKEVNGEQSQETGGSGAMSEATVLQPKL